jgi:ABC-type transport system involved in cytochrome bd biosynthesis fused ATPase/permease subunit
LRALCAVRLGAGLVLLDEPTAQLDVRGEAASASSRPLGMRPRFSFRTAPPYQTDRICVLERGRVVSSAPTTS